MGEISRPTDYAAAISKIIQLATDIVASLDVESYYPWANFFQTHESLPEYLQNIVVGDHVLTFRQISPNDALSIMRGAFAWVDSNTIREKLGWDIQDALQFAECTLLGVPVDRVNAVFTPARLQSSGLSDSTLVALKACLTYSADEVNAKYVTPADAEKTNAQFKPLPDGSLLMVSPPIASIGFYEGIAAALRATFSQQTTR